MSTMAPLNVARVADRPGPRARRPARRRSPRGTAVAAGAADGLGEAGRPDEVVREDDDGRRQVIVQVSDVKSSSRRSPSPFSARARSICAGHELVVRRPLDPLAGRRPGPGTRARTCARGCRPGRRPSRRGRPGRDSSTPSPSSTTSRPQAREADALVGVLAEDHRLAVLEPEHAVVADVLVGELPPGAVVEDVAVLEHLDEGRAACAGRPRRASPGCARCRCPPCAPRRWPPPSAPPRAARRAGRWCPSGEDFVRLPNSRRRRGLALGQAVDAVVEHDQLDVHVAAHRVEDVVAADARARRRRR